MPKVLKSKDFAEHLHTTFHIETPIDLDLELTDVTDRSNTQIEQFSILFAGAASPWLRQGTYPLAHPAMGQLELFLVPLGPRDGRMVYQSIFSKLIATSL